MILALMPIFIFNDDSSHSYSADVAAAILGDAFPKSGKNSLHTSCMEAELL